MSDAATGVLLYSSRPETGVRGKEGLMNRTELQGMRQLFDDGNMIWVTNQHNHMQGRVIGFETDRIEVEVDKHCERWDIDICT